MAGQAVYRKVAGKFGAAAAKMYLYGDASSALQNAVDSYREKNNLSPKELKAAIKKGDIKPPDGLDKQREIATFFEKARNEANKQRKEDALAHQEKREAERQERAIDRAYQKVQWRLF